MIKKVMVIIPLFVIVVGIIFFASMHEGGDVSNVKQSIASSNRHSKDDIEDAMNIVKKAFKKQFKGCTLTDLWYDEEFSSSFEGSWVITYDGDEAIILLSNFDVGQEGGDGSLNPNDTYPDWQWILVRKNGGKWKLKTYGY